MLDSPNAESNPSLGTDDPIWQRRIGNRQFYLSELAPIVTMDTPTAQFADVPEGVQDFVAVNGLSMDGIGAGTWRASKYEWAAIALLQALSVGLTGEDGSEIRVSLSEIAPFLKANAQPEDFVDQTAATKFADKIVGFNTKPLADLAVEVRKEILHQDPIVQLRKMTESDWNTIDARKAEFYPAYA